MWDKQEGNNIIWILRYSITDGNDIKTITR